MLPVRSAYVTAATTLGGDTSNKRVRGFVVANFSGNNVEPEFKASASTGGTVLLKCGVVSNAAGSYDHNIPGSGVLFVGGCYVSVAPSVYITVYFD